MPPPRDDASKPPELRTASRFDNLQSTDDSRTRFGNEIAPPMVPVQQFPILPLGQSPEFANYSHRQEVPALGEPHLPLSSSLHDASHLDLLGARAPIITPRSGGYKH